MKQEHIDQVAAAVSAVAERLEKGEVKNIYFVACGGSQANMMPAQYMFDRELDIPAAIYTSNEFNYGTPKNFGANSVVITCSHSGTTPETVAAAQKATDAGALSIAFSNEVDSPLWNAAMYPIHYDHGPEAVDCDKGGSVMMKLWFELLRILDPANADVWQSGSDAIDGLINVKNAASEKYRETAVKFASDNKRAQVIYTMGSGANYGEMYSLAICLFMEMQWIHSNCIHSGEYFHGPFEVLDKNQSFFLLVAEGRTRKADERAERFLKEYGGDKVYVLDAKELGINRFKDSVAEYFNHMLFSPILNNTYMKKLSEATKIDYLTRRYMWKVQY